MTSSRPLSRPGPGWPALVLLAAAGLGLAAAPAAAAAAPQIEEVDLPPVGVPEEELSEAEADSTQAIFDRAYAAFLSPEQRSSIELFGQVVDRLESASLAAELAPEERDLLARSYFYRGEARFNFGESRNAEEDFRSAIRTDPSFAVDRSRTSPKLADLFEKLRAEVAGLVEMRIQPPDAEVEIVELGNRSFPASAEAPMPLLAGTWHAIVRRPGYAPTEVVLEIAAGERRPLEVELPRTSAVVRLQVPAGSSIELDGAAVDTAAAAPVGADAIELAIDGLGPGTHVLEVAKEGFRTVRRELLISDLIDYPAEPVVLVPSRGTVEIAGLPEAAMLTLDGEPLSPRRGPGGAVSMELPAREHHLIVEQDGVGRFERVFELEDRETERIAVRLRPAIALLGVLGGDREAAERLLGRLRGSLGELQDWWLVDASEAARPIFSGLGLAAAELRGGGAAGRLPVAARSELAGRFRAQIALLAVLSDDLFAAEADLWIWSGQAPSLAPEVSRVAIDADGASLAPLLASLERPLRLARPWLGAHAIDSAVSEGPVVAAVTPAGPAARAGLGVGDQIVAVGGRRLASATELARALAASAPGSTLRLTVRGRSGPREVEIALGESPAVLAPDDAGVLAPAALARLGLEAARDSPAAPRWVLELNRAAALQRAGAWREAVQVLREIRAPADAPLGQAAVDYWLGAALLAADPAAYAAHAREAFARAAAAPAGRLLHNDGPLVAPRARARAAELGGG